MTAQQRALIKQLERWMVDHPGAGAVVAISDIGARANIWRGQVGCGPMHLIVIAELLLEDAARELTRIAGAEREFLPHLKMVETARAALDLYQERPQA